MAAIPYLARNAARYFDADLDTRYGAPAPDLLTLCSDNTPCLSYPTETSLESALVDGPSFRIDDFGQGCGSPEFPPNANFLWDWQNAQAVQTRCEHYGLGDADDGSDQPSTYSFDTVAASEQGVPDCGGPWQLYWRQNMPGLDNEARADDGSPMKNWWPFLFF